MIYDMLDNLKLNADPAQRQRLYSYAEAMGTPPHMTDTASIDPLTRYESFLYSTYKILRTGSTIVNLAEPPTCSALVPIAGIEKPETVRRTLSEIDRESKSLTGPLEVTAWINPRIVGEALFVDPWSGYAERKVQDILEVVFGFQPSGSMILRPAISHSYAETTMSVLRTHATDGIIGNLILRSIPLDGHPILWIDVDTPWIGEGSLAKLVTAVKGRQAHFVKLNVSFTGDYPKDIPLSQLSEAQRVAVVYAEARDILEGVLRPDQSRPYDEEHGLGFTAATWEVTGGIDLADPTLGETKTMFARGRQKLDPSMPLVAYLSDAPIGTLNRRIEVLAGQVRAYEIPGRIDGGDYDTFSDAQAKVAASTRTYPVMASEVAGMVRRMVEQYETARGAPIDKRHYLPLADLIARCQFLPDAILEF